DRADTGREAKAIRYLRERQGLDGGWNLYEGGPSNVSVTIKAYFAMKMVGIDVDDPAMARAREFVPAHGGPVAANVFTKILLALLAEYAWPGLPSMPPETPLLPRWASFTPPEVSSWPRTASVPLTALLEKKPVRRLPGARLDELWPVPRAQARLR